MHSKGYLNRVRRLLKGSNYLLTLIDAYRTDELTENEREHLWVGISDLAIKLANKHYGEKQHIKKTYLACAGIHSAEEKQAIRVQYIYEFIRDYKEGTPAVGILYAIHRRFAYLEMLVECKFIGLAIAEDVPMPTRTNMGLVRDIMLGAKLYRRLHHEFKRHPTDKEILVEYAAHRIEQGKLVGWQDLQRFANRVFPYYEIRNAKYATELPENI